VKAATVGIFAAAAIGSSLTMSGSTPADPATGPAPAAHVAHGR